VQVGHHKKAAVLLLQAHVIAHRPKVITQVQKPGGTDTAHHNLLLLIHRGEDS